MFDPAKYAPPPGDLGTSNSFSGCQIPITRMLEEILKKGRSGRIDKVHFQRCAIFGPGVVMPDLETRFNRCDLGNINGDVRNLFMIAAGPRITGAIELKACVFDDCVFRGVGFVSNQGYVDGVIAELMKAGQGAV